MDNEYLSKHECRNIKFSSIRKWSKLIKRRKVVIVVIVERDTHTDSWILTRRFFLIYRVNYVSGMQEESHAGPKNQQEIDPSLKVNKTLVFPNRSAA